MYRFVCKELAYKVLRMITSFLITGRQRLYLCAPHPPLTVSPSLSLPLALPCITPPSSQQQTELYANTKSHNAIILFGVNIWIFKCRVLDLDVPPSQFPYTECRRLSLPTWQVEDFVCAFASFFFSDTILVEHTIIFMIMFLCHTHLLTMQVTYV